MTKVAARGIEFSYLSLDGPARSKKPVHVRWATNFYEFEGELIPLPLPERKPIRKGGLLLNAIRF